MRIIDWSSDVCSSDLVAPLIGLRVRLSANFKSTQQNTGGEKAKFGLTAPQILEALEMLRAAGRLDAVQMIHFHLGSQVANVQDVARGLREASRFYVELRRLGAPLDVVDVGGGLGVDYEGTGSRTFKVAERRGGTGWVRSVRSWGSTYH